MPVAAAEEGQPPEPLEGSAAELRLLWEWDRQQDAARESAWHEGRCRIRDAQLAAEQAGRRMAAAEAAQTAGALAQQIGAEQRRADALRGELLPGRARRLVAHRRGPVGQHYHHAGHAGAAAAVARRQPAAAVSWCVSAVGKTRWWWWWWSWWAWWSW